MNKSNRSSVKQMNKYDWLSAKHSSLIRTSLHLMASVCHWNANRQQPDKRDTNFLGSTFPVQCTVSSKIEKVFFWSIYKALKRLTCSAFPVCLDLGFCTFEDFLKGEKGLYFEPFQYTWKRKKSFWTFFLNFKSAPFLILCDTNLTFSPTKG